jgi:hypothetical protein
MGPEGRDPLPGNSDSALGVGIALVKQYATAHVKDVMFQPGPGVHDPSRSLNGQDLRITLDKEHMDDHAIILPHKCRCGLHLNAFANQRSRNLFILPLQCFVREVSLFRVCYRSAKPSRYDARRIMSMPAAHHSGGPSITRYHVLKEVCG